MASTTAVPSTNGAAIVGATSHPSSSSSPSTTNAMRSSQKAGSIAKTLETARKSASSPMDNAQKPPATQKAWTVGTNPLTQKALHPPRPNGVVSSAKQDARPSNSTTTKSPHSKLTFLLSTSIGSTARVTLQNGEQFTGIFSSASIESKEPRYILKMVTNVTSTKSMNDGSHHSTSDHVGEGDDFTMAFDPKEVVDLEVMDINLEKSQNKAANGVSAAFKTDTDISGNLSFRERKLKMWEPSADDNGALSLHDSGNTSWDQFETNERLYGVKSDFDENLYTTPLDRSHPDFDKRAAAADRLAREIEASATTNSHVAEERGQVVHEDTGDMDEESRFSGVRRDFQPQAASQNNKYTPPARRPPAGQATVQGVPVDPAIISSQLARPSPPPIHAQDKASPQQSNLDKDDAMPHTESVPKVLPDSNVKARNGIGKVDGADSEHAQTTAEGGSSGASNPASTPNATANVEAEVLESYKSWAAQEKLKLQVQRAQAARREREVKLNDLKKFSANFKLNTKVPSDLVPILAKDKQKQEEIVAKAERQLESQPIALPKTVVSPGPGVSRPAASTELTQGGSSQSGDRGTLRGGRQSALNKPPQVKNATPPEGRSSLSARLAQTTQQYKERNPNSTSTVNSIPARDPRAVPEAIEIQNMAPLGKPTPSPTSSQALKFNAKAVEFRPTAPSFTPTSGQSVVASSRAENGSQVGITSTTRPSFLENKKQRLASERPSIANAFNPIARMLKEGQADKKADYSSNGGIPQAYRTPPTWEVAPENQEKSYKDMFQRYLAHPLSRSTSHTSQASGPFAHQHQLPLHMQSSAHTPAATPHGTPRHPQSQPHHGPTPGFYEDNRMHLSASSSSAFPSPRQPQPVIYTPMMSQMQGVYPQPVPQFGMHPGTPGMPQMRVMQPGAPYMQMQASNGGSVMAYPVQQQHLPGYSPGQGHGFPSQLPQIHGQQMYGSPRQSAPMMVQQGSQQGQMVQPFGYPSPNLQGGFMFPPQHPQASMNSMRGPMPMQQQQGYGASPHLQYHHPATPQHGRGSFSSYNNQAPPNQGAHHHSHASGDDTQRGGT